MFIIALTRIQDSFCPCVFSQNCNPVNILKCCEERYNIQRPKQLIFYSLQHQFDVIMDFSSCPCHVVWFNCCAFVSWHETYTNIKYTNSPSACIQMSFPILYVEAVFFNKQNTISHRLTTNLLYFKEVEQTIGPFLMGRLKPTSDKHSRSNHF